jgi:hypothetical protein
MDIKNPKVAFFPQAQFETVQEKVRKAARGLQGRIVKREQLRSLMAIGSNASLSAYVRTSVAWGLIDRSEEGYTLSDLGLRLFLSERGSEKYYLLARDAILHSSICADLIDRFGTEQNDQEIKYYLGSMDPIGFTVRETEIFLPIFRSCQEIIARANAIAPIRNDAPGDALAA